MMKYTIYLLLTTIIVLNSCIPPSQRVYSTTSSPSWSSSSGQPQSRSAPMPNAKPGACYAKAIAPDQHITETITLPIYTGDTQSLGPNVDTQTIILSPRGERWVKKKANVNCLSKNPDDCLVWCLVEIPQEETTVNVVIDTTMTTEYEMADFTKTVEYNFGESIWTEVICEKDKDLVLNQVNTKLVALMYLSDVDASDDTLLSALKTYQKEHNLPSGSLNFDTLDALGVSYLCLITCNIDQLHASSHQF